MNRESFILFKDSSIKGILLYIFLLFCMSSNAQTSDSLIVQILRNEGVKFSHNNSVTLLMTGQEKFDDMFTAIRQAKSSIHLE